MAKRTAAGAARRTAPAKGGGKMTTESEDLMTTTFRIRREQWMRLRTEATRRALESDKGDRRPDASWLVREAIDLWLERNAR
jgi:hypothetical protein